MFNIFSPERLDEFGRVIKKHTDSAYQVKDDAHLRALTSTSSGILLLKLVIYYTLYCYFSLINISEFLLQCMLHMITV